MQLMRRGSYRKKYIGMTTSDAKFILLEIILNNLYNNDKINFNLPDNYALRLSGGRVHPFFLGPSLKSPTKL